MVKGKGKGGGVTDDLLPFHSQHTLSAGYDVGLMVLEGAVVFIEFRHHICCDSCELKIGERETVKVREGSGKVDK